MSTTSSLARWRTPIVGAAVALAAACTDQAPVEPGLEPIGPAMAELRPTPGNLLRAITTLRRATARYHDLDAALADGFVFLHDCEVRPGEGAVGMLYVHMERLMDGVIDPSRPDALVYEPGRRASDRPQLVGVELAVPYSLWTGTSAPTFLGATFQPEDEFGVFGLHVWVWRANPDGLFAEANPRVSCGRA
jgi:hypothetical protein